MESDCNEGCKEIERIETLVLQVKQELYSMCDNFKSIISSRIYGPTVKDDLKNLPAEPEPTNKLDRVMLDLHRIINTLKDFNKKNLAELDSELSKI